MSKIKEENTIATTIEENLIRRIALGDIIRRRAQSHSNKEAIVEFIDGKRLSLTYGEFNNRLNQFVRAMREHGIKQGDRVAILGANSSAFLTALVGSFKGGFVAVPINYLQNPDDIRYNIEHSGTRAIFADAGLHPLVDRIVNNQDADFLSITLIGEPDMNKNPFLRMEDFLKGQSVKEIEDIVIEDDDTAQIMYTSGTTARPKGVMGSHKNLFISSLNSALTSGVGKDSADSAIVLPIFHITAETAGMLTLHLGAKAVLINGFQPETILHLIESERIQVIALLPLMWKALLSSPEINQHDYSSLRTCFYGMAPMDNATLNALKEQFSGSFILGSGQTEIAGVSTMLDPYWGDLKEGNYWGDGSITCDQAVMDDSGKILPKGEIGEIVWRSPQAMIGYYKNEEATALSREFGWHHSGDIGYIDEDNQFHFIDRKKDIVKSGGENVSSVKIEESILELDEIANVGIVGLPHDYWGEAVTAFVSLKPGFELSEELILRHCKNVLGKFEVPKKIVFVNELPMTATGKVKKHLLRLEYEKLYNN